MKKCRSPSARLVKIDIPTGRTTPTLRGAALGLCWLANYITPKSPAKCTRLLKTLPNTEVVKTLIEGWQAAPLFVVPDVAAVLQALARDPSPLTTALTPCPHTLVHSDLRTANIGVVPGAGQV